MKASVILAAAFLTAIIPVSPLPAAPAARANTSPPSTCGLQPAAGSSLRAWLNQSAVLKERIVWITGDGKELHYDQWPAAMKNRMDAFYRKLATGERDLGIRLPNAAKFKTFKVFFTADEAFDMYAAHVAHVLYVEAKRLVPWSIQSRPAAELDQLLASGSYFARIIPSPAPNEYPAGIQANRDFQEAPENEDLAELIGDPRIGFDFLSGKTSSPHENLIAKTELETLVNLTVWLRDNVAHGPMDDKQLERVAGQHWLDERLHAFPGGKLAIAIQGCHSATKLMVDLARSVNIPLLSVRSLDGEKGDKACHFFSRTHGGLVYGWGGPTPRIVYHTDMIYARAGKICFPLDVRTGELLPAAQADQRYFDACWLSPAMLSKAGFVFHLERVVPEKGFGHTSRHKHEDRQDYGWMCGYWKKEGASNLAELYDVCMDYELCGLPWVEHCAKFPRARSFLASLVKSHKGGFADDELPLALPIKDESERVAAVLKAAGGSEPFLKLAAEHKSKLGSNLLPPVASR